MIEIVVSGFQDGADMGGVLAAHKAGLRTGGWMPKGFRTESGPRPHYAELYGALEDPSPEYPPRTRANVLAAHAVLWFGRAYSPGGRLTLGLTRQRELPSLVVPFPPVAYDVVSPERVAEWIDLHLPSNLMVAGNRESSAPGIGAYVEGMMGDVFRMVSVNIRRATV